MSFEQRNTTAIGVILDCRHASLYFGNTPSFEASAVTVATILSIMSVPTIMSNLLVCIAFIKRKTLRIGGNKVLLSLALSDFLCGAIVQPLLAITIYIVIFKSPSKCPCWLIVTMGITGYTLACVSLLTVAFVSLERYIAIFYPFQATQTMTPKVVYTSCVAVWLFSILLINGVLFLNLARAFYWINATMIAFTYIWNCFVYARITRQARKLRRKLAVRQSMFLNETLKVRKSRGTQIAGSIIIALLVCYLPQVIVSLLKLITRAYFVTEYLEYWAMTFGLANSMLNPLLYCYYNTEIRNELLRLVGFRRKPKLKTSVSTVLNNHVNIGNNSFTL